MENKIIKILKENSWEMEKGRFVICKSNIRDIVKEIEKILPEPPATSHICSECLHIFPQPKNATYCSNCGGHLY